MKLFSVQKRRTRSGAVFSRFQVATIENPSFNLAESIKLASQQEIYEDDPILTSPPLDSDAREFWRSATSSSEIFVPQPAPLFLFPVRRDASLDAVDAGRRRSASPRPQPRDATSSLRTEPRPAPAAVCSLKRSFDDDPPQPTPSVVSPFKRPRPRDDDPKPTGRNVRAHKKRSKRKNAQAEAQGRGYHAPRPEVIAAHVEGAPPIKTDLKAEELPSTSGGYAARSKLPDIGYRLVEWDGVIGMPLVCSEGRVFACLVGQPSDDPTYAASCRLAYEAIMEEGRNASFSESETNHRRGKFPAVNVGVTMGLGATYPTNLSCGAHAGMISRLLGNPHIIRIANFADSAFNLWAPNLYRHYCDHLRPLFARRPNLRHIFPRSVFPAAAFNFGPNVCTKSHRDCMNSAIGWCGIHALGPFDPKKGGHLVLPDLKVVVEFPPGSLIMIPSATLTHANLPVQEGDSRISFTQYCGGGLLRYVDNGYRTETQLRKEDPKEYARMCSLKSTRWEEDLKLYSLLTDCVSPLEDAASVNTVLTDHV